MLNLEDWERKTLEQLLDSGIRQSIESMAKLSQTQWEVVSVSLKDGAPEQFLKEFSRDSSPHMGVHVTTQKNCPLHFLVMFSAESANSLVGALGKAYNLDLNNMAEANRSMLEEAGNILVGSFLNTLANSSKTMILAAAPKFREGKKETLLAGALEDLNKQIGISDHILMVRITMYAGSLLADCDYLVIASGDYLKKLVSSVSLA